MTRCQNFLSLVFLVLSSWTAVSTWAKKDFNLPHAHRGLLTPFKAGPFSSLKLDRSDEKTLSSGQPVMKQTEGGDGGGAICVQDVNAPKEAVWSQILDLEKYKGKVPKVVRSKNYKMDNKADGTSNFKTEMVVRVIPGYSYTSFYDHTFSPAQDSMTWTLDYDKTSDFDDVAGHWHVEDHPEKPKCARVFYACDIKFKGTLPRPVVHFLSKTALKVATGWVKKESEKNPAGKIPSMFQAPAFQKK